MRRNLLLSFILISCQHLLAQSLDTSHLNQMRVRFIGPDGNRAIAVVGVPGNPMISYVGAASGGIFKTEDAGTTWKPIFDDMDNSSIGALAIAPSNTNHIWAGTGETFLIRPAHAMGNGVYKSTDGGATWKNMGLQKTARISRVIVHPTDSNTVYVAALGNASAPQQERGVYKTTDGGKTWNRVFFVDENTGCSDMSMDVKNPDILFAAAWQVDIKTWGLNSGGAGSGIYRTQDGGKTWQPLRNGLPSGAEHPVGKTSVDVAQSNPKIVYALIEDKVPSLYKSEDGGDSWKLMFQSHSMAQRAPYYTRVRVSSQNPNRVHTICVTIMTSNNGGKSFNGNGNYQWGGDTHDMWYDPRDSNRIMVAHDGCLNMTFNGGKTSSNINLPIAQLYHISTDNQVPYNVLTNRQDGYSYRAPSNSLARGIPLGAWQGVGGCESGYAQADPFDSNIIWSGCYDGGLDVFDMRTKHARDVRVYPENGYGWAPADMKYRWHWNYPMVLSKHRKGMVLVGSQFVHQTTNGGQSWQIISPDLTTNDKSHQQSSGGMNSDNLMTFDGCTLYYIAESPLKEGIIWTGSNDGQINVTKDGGKNWTNVTANIKGLPKWGTIRCIDPSNFEVGAAYISIVFNQLGDFDPYIYKTTDYGATWTPLSNTFPKSNSSFIHQIREDPAKKGLLWAGSDNGLYFSPDDGGTWIQLKNNLPPAPIYGLVIQKDFNDLVIGTYGRGAYILDDITPIRALATSQPLPAIALLPIRKAYRFQEKQAIHTERSFVSGQNPPDGASIHYFLKDTSFKDSIKITVADAQGNLIQTIEGNKKVGINRLWWDLRHQEIVMPPLRTKPRGKDWVKLDSLGKRNMFIYDLDVGPGIAAPLVAPGIYTVTLQIGKTLQTQKVEILKDPNTVSSLEDIKKQYSFGINLYQSIKTCFDLIDKIEQMRAKLLAKAAAPNATDKPSLLKIEDDLWQIESQVHDIYQTGARQDAFRNPSQLLERFLSISKETLVGGADFPPSDQHQAVYKKLNGQLDAVKMRYEAIKRDMGAVN